jgi:hypothetical protein
MGTRKGRAEEEKASARPPPVLHRSAASAPMPAAAAPRWLLLLLLLLLCHPQARQSGCVSKLPAARATSQVATPNIDTEICH